MAVSLRKNVTASRTQGVGVGQPPITVIAGKPVAK